MSVRLFCIFGLLLKALERVFAVAASGGESSCVGGRNLGGLRPRCRAQSAVPFLEHI